MNRTVTIPGPQAPAVASSAVTEPAVAADEQRIAIALVDTVIRDLFRVGLTLHSALPHVSGLAEERLNTAIDGLDRTILRIRAVVFDLAIVDEPRNTDCISSRPNGADSVSVPLEPAPATDLAVRRCQCGHTELEHDVVAGRYCAATASAELTRGCICRAPSGDPRP